MSQKHPVKHSTTPAHLTLHPRTPQEAKELHLVWKSAIVSIVVIATNVFGNYCLTRGLRTIGVITSWSPIPYIHAFQNPWVSIGVIFMIAWLVSRLALLSWADLSYVLPVTAFSYVLTAIVGAVCFSEHVNRLHWIGISLITLGVAIVAITPPETLLENGQQ